MTLHCKPVASRSSLHSTLPLSLLSSSALPFPPPSNASLSDTYVVAPQGFKVYLVDNAFELPFPVTITALKHLTLLSITGSGLSGSLPAALFTMPNLKHLDLTNNKLSGRIPDAVGLATCLQTMDLSSNYLHGSLPASMGNLSHLTSLTLTDINLNGTLPAALFTIPTLKHLVITKTAISGSIPNEVGLATGLQTLDLSHNWLTGSLPASLGNLSSLLHLNLERNGLSGTIPEAISNLKHLQKLNLGRQKLSGPIPESIGALTNLQEMLLFQTRLSGTIPASIGNLTALTSLYLCDNRLAGTIPAGISRLINLRELYFANNQLVGALPAIHRMAHLQYLHAEENYLKATANPLPQCPTTSTPCNGTSGCPVLYVYKNCLASEPIGCNYDMQHGCLSTRGVFCREFQAQRRDSECQSFCGAQFLTPPCSGHGVCSIVPNPSSDLPVCKDEHPPSFCNPNEGKAQCTCDEGYTPGTAAGTCVPQALCVHVLVCTTHPFTTFYYLLGSFLHAFPALLFSWYSPPLRLTHPVSRNLL
ncbi:unnamed protein product [Closterium sp. Yama58-4]|nr:unnamed protein product [Closterium sp. Yama58-4]